MLKQEQALFKQNNVTLKDYAADFFSLTGKNTEKKKSFNSSINDRWILEKESIVNNHIIKSSLSEKYLREITDDDLELFITKIKPVRFTEHKLSANTKKKILLVLNIIFKKAYRERLIDRIPMLDEKIQGPSKEKDILTVNELQKLFPEQWENIYPNRRAYVGNLISATTAIRLSECLCLQIKQIDFNNKSIRINQAWDKKLQIILPTPKNKQSREVPVCDKVLNEIKLLISENPNPENPDSFLFYGEAHGKPVDHKFLPRHFFNALKKVNIDISDKSVSWHSLRHGANTHLLEAGINPYKVAAFLGHSKKGNMTALYNHSTLSDMQDIRNFYSNLLSIRPALIILKGAM